MNNLIQSVYEHIGPNYYRYRVSRITVRDFTTVKLDPRALSTIGDHWKNMPPLSLTIQHFTSENVAQIESNEKIRTLTIFYNFYRKYEGPINIASKSLRYINCDVNIRNLTFCGSENVTRIFTFSTDIVKDMPNLTHLEITDDLPYLIDPASCQNLNTLILAKCDSSDNLDCLDFTNMPKLRHLTTSVIWDVPEIPQLETIAIYTPRHVIDIDRLHQNHAKIIVLDLIIKDFNILKNMVNLQTLTISNVSEYPKIWHLLNLENLDISFYKEFDHGLKMSDFYKFPKLKKLSVDWITTYETLTDLPKSGVTNLSIKNSNIDNLTFSLFPKLEKIQLRKCGALKSYMIENLPHLVCLDVDKIKYDSTEITASIYGKITSASFFSKWTIDDRIITLFPNLIKLEVYESRKLTGITFHVLTKLRELVLIHCDSVKSQYLDDLPKHVAISIDYE
jgi:hypothetical protein